MSQPDLSIVSIDVAGEITVLAIAGELDLRTQEPVRAQVDALLARGRIYLVFDLTAMTFCDSTGMGMFIDLDRAARSRNGWIRLAALTPFVLRSFHLLNLEQVFDLHDTTDNAITGRNGAPPA